MTNASFQNNVWGTAEIPQLSLISNVEGVHIAEIPDCSLRLRPQCYVRQSFQAAPGLSVTTGGLRVMETSSLKDDDCVPLLPLPDAESHGGEDGR